MINRLLILSSVILLAACGGRNAAPPEEGIKLQQNVKVYINSHIPYYDPLIIASNIKQECSNLGSALSNYIQSYSDDYNINIVQVEEPVKVENGFVLDLKIRNAVSAGNAWTGHKKQILISAELLRNGQKVKDFTANRNSMGGFWGGFKGSCDVLDRTVNTLGSDTAAWLSNNL